MAARCPRLAEHGYFIAEDGSVTLTRPCEDMAPEALTDLKAALMLLGDRAVYLRAPQPTMWARMCSAMHAWLGRHENDRATFVSDDRR